MAAIIKFPIGRRVTFSAWLEMKLEQALKLHHVSVSTLPDGAPSRLFDGVPSSRSRTL
jgi:hypothetical protein